MNIKRIRESKDMTQEKLAEMLGIGRSTVSMWETNQSLPRADLLPKIASILGSSVDEILGVKTNTKRSGRSEG